MQAQTLPGRTFPQVLLQELLAVLTGWQPPQRYLAHLLFSALLPAAPAGLRDPQTASILSALWHEARPPCVAAPAAKTRWLLRYVYASKYQMLPLWHVFVIKGVEKGFSYYKMIGWHLRCIGATCLLDHLTAALTACTGGGRGM